MTLSPLRLDIDPLAASPPPIALADLKQHARFEAADFDGLLPTYLLSAIEFAEGAMHRTIVQRTHRWILRDFPRGRRQEIHLPRGVTQSVASVSYVAGGATTVLTGPSSGSPAGTGYQEDLSGDDGGVLMPNAGASWPSVDCDDHPAPVTITFSAGWAAADIPAEILHRLMFLVTDALDLPGTADAATQTRPWQTVPDRENLFSAWRLSRWY